MKRRQSNLAFNVIANYAAMLVAIVAPIVFNAIYLTRLGREEFGIIGIATTIAGLASVLDFGMSRVVMREVARLSHAPSDEMSSRDVLATFAVPSLIVSGLVAAGIALSNHVLVEHWLSVSPSFRPTAENAILIIALFTFLTLIPKIFQACLIGIEAQVANAMIGVGAVLARGFLALLVLQIPGTGVLAVLATQAVVTVAEFAVVVTFCHRALPRTAAPPMFRMILLRRYRTFIAYDGSTSALSVIFNFGDRIVLSTLLPLDQFGIYSFAASVAVGIGRLSGPIISAFYPRLIHAVEAKDYGGLLRIYKTALLTLVCIIFSTASVAIFSGREVLLLLSGSSREPAGFVIALAFLAAAAAVNCLTQLPHSLYLAHARTTLVFWVHLFNTVLYFTVTFILTKSVGVYFPAIVIFAISTENFLIIWFGTHLKVLPRDRRPSIALYVLFPLAVSLIAYQTLHHFAAIPVETRIGAFLVLSIYGAGAGIASVLVSGILWRYTVR